MKEAPTPPGNPLFGLIPGVVNSRTRLATFLRLQAEVGDVIRLEYGPKTSYVLFHPDHVKHVLVDNQRNYPKSRDYRKLRPLMGDGLVTSGGELWVRQRKLVQPAFHPAAIGLMAEGMGEATRQMLARWETQPLDMMHEMMDLTQRIAARSLFGADVGAAAEAVARAVPMALDEASRRMTTLVDLPKWLPTPGNLRYQAAIRELDRVVNGIIEARRRNPGEQVDLLARLLAARDPETGEGMSDQQLRDEVMTVFLAGHETTATALTWMWYLVAGAPEVEARLHAEVDAVVAGEAPTLEEASRLTYTTQVLEEAMRLFPPVWFIKREAVEEDEVGGYRIEKSREIGIVPYVTHRHPEFWENPSAFDPDRFAPERAAGRHRFAFFPFSGGPRVCVGGHFAMLEAKIIVATVARRYRLASVPGARVEPKPSVTLRPRYGMWLRPVAREGDPS